MALDLNNKDKDTIIHAIEWLKGFLYEIKDSDILYHRKQSWEQVINYLVANKHLIR